MGVSASGASGIRHTELGRWLERAGGRWTRVWSGAAWRVVVWRVARWWLGLGRVARRGGAERGVSAQKHPSEIRDLLSSLLLSLRLHVHLPLQHNAGGRLGWPGLQLSRVQAGCAEWSANQTRAQPE